MLEGGEIHDIYEEYSESGESGNLPTTYKAKFYDHKYLMNFSTLMDNWLVMDFETHVEQ
jgi:hypothetical protein